MNNRYRELFMPCVLENGVILKNRICFSNGLQSFSVAPSKGPDELLMNDLAIFSRSGASLMSIGHYGLMGGGAAPRPKQKTDKKAIRDRGERVVIDSPFSLPDSAAAFDYEDDKTWSLIAQTAQGAHLFDTRVLVKLGVSFPPGVSLNGVQEAEEALLFPVDRKSVV